MPRFVTLGHHSKALAGGEVWTPPLCSDTFLRILKGTVTLNSSTVGTVVGSGSRDQNSASACPFTPLHLAVPTVNNRAGDSFRPLEETSLRAQEVEATPPVRKGSRQSTLIALSRRFPPSGTARGWLG